MFVHAILVTKCQTVVLTSMTLPSLPNGTLSGKSLSSWVESFVFPYIVVIVIHMQTCNNFCNADSVHEELNTEPQIPNAYFIYNQGKNSRSRYN